MSVYVCVSLFVSVFLCLCLFVLFSIGESLHSFIKPFLGLLKSTLYLENNDLKGYNICCYITLSSLATYTSTKSENFAVGGTIVQVAATDGDSSNTADGVVSYAFVTPQTLFNIDSATGAIVLASSLDRETVGTHTILVTASDVATTVTATVSLTVGDENDNAPVFTAATYT